MSGVPNLIERLAVAGMLVMSLLPSNAYPEGPAAVQPNGNPAGGQTLYAQLCASCHGALGRGDGVVSNELLLRPRDFALNAFKFDTDADWERGTDVDLANVIRNGPAAYGGSSLMPPWSSLSDDDVAALVAYIRTLQQKGG